MPEPQTSPRLSIVVLNYNRRELLRRVLRSIRSQVLREFELLVVDNGSDDGSADVVEAEFPEARLLRQNQNLGVAGRNIGFRAARAGVILSLDNDIELLDTDTTQRIVEEFENDSRLGVLTLKICRDSKRGGRDFDPDHWWHPLPRAEFQDTGFLTDHMNEAAVAFRAEALSSGGYYDETLFWGGEEWDLSLTIMERGFDLRYAPIPVLHLAPRGNLNLRMNPRTAVLIRNRCWIALRRLPLTNALTYMIPRLVIWGLRAVRYGYLTAYFQGLAQLVVSLPGVWRRRDVISSDTIKRLRKIQSQRRLGRPLPRP